MDSTKRNVLVFECDLAESLGQGQYLTPVYFNKQVLIRYLYDSRFYCDFASETYGTVGNDDFDIPFGINRSGTVIAWLGDLMQKLPQRERFYWLVENKAPENDAQSEFFDAQINAQFTPPPAAVGTLNALARLNSAFHKRFEVHLYHDRSLEERIEETRRYKRLILNNLDDFKRFLSEFNEIINENTNNTEVKRLLIGRGAALPETAKGNKLLEKVYKELLGDTDNLIAPFFYLYDLRLWADHTSGDTKRDAVAVALGVTDVSDYNSLMSALLKALRESCVKLEGKVGA
jgi:hypothetical protein